MIGLRRALGLGLGVATCGYALRAPAGGPVPRISTARSLGTLFDLLGGANELVAPGDALPGRAQRMPGIEGSRHAVLGTVIEDVPEGHKVAYFANGCFWGSEKGAWRLPRGIHSTAVGYCGGFTPNPTYEEACSGRTGHTEGVRVVYDPREVSYVDILRWFAAPASRGGPRASRATPRRRA